MERRGRWSGRAQPLPSSGFWAGQVIHRRKTCRKEQEAMSGSYALNFHLDCSAHWGSLEMGTRVREARFCASCLLLWNLLLPPPQLYTAVPQTSLLSLVWKGMLTRQSLGIKDIGKKQIFGQNPSKLCVDIDKLTLKFIWGGKRPGRANTVLKDRSGELTLLDVKTY